jgi:hypothetical protein
LDTNCKPNHKVPMWNETRWGGCFNPEQGVGLFLHAGRLRGNLDWWWAQTAIYLPGGRVAVERSWIRNKSDIGVKTASIDLRAERVGWSAQFDGIVELTTREALSKAPRGSSAPSVQASFNVVADGSRPLWDMMADLSGKEIFADKHVQQAGQCTGTLQVGNESYRLDGVSYYDHSSGVRDYTEFHSHHFGMIAMPNATIEALCIYRSATEVRGYIGVWFTKEGKKLKIEKTTMQRLTNLSSLPEPFDWVVKVEGLEAQTFRVEVLHSFPCTITFDNDNINGVDWELSGDPAFYTEYQVKVTAPDGSVGYGHLECSNRRSCLSRS